MFLNISGHKNDYCNIISALLEIQRVPAGHIADAASYSAALPMNLVQQRYWSNQHSVFTKQYYNIATPVTLIALGAGRGGIAPALHIQEKSNTAANKCHC